MFWLQSQPVLPDAMACAGLVLIGLVCLPLAHRLTRNIPNSITVSRMSLRAVVGIAIGVAIGIGWAGLFAHGRLSEELPAQLEGRDLQVIGVVDSLPDAVASGVRFRLHVDSARLPGGEKVSIPELLSVGWYADGAQSPPTVRPGQRWEFTLRLRLPHGHVNPDGFDYEAWLLTEGVRATGYVRPGLQKMHDAFVPGLAAYIGRARDVLRTRLQHALPDAEYAGVIIALVIGDQRGVSQSDWDVFNRTGIGHLVSISGLHITMIAALFGGLARWLWRHSFFTRANLPLLLPAQKVGAAAGWLTALVYVALAGFGIPAQRTLLMLTVVSVALWLGRITSVSHVLCLSIIVVLLCDPWAVLWPGFWLSFVAIACILYAAVGRNTTEEGGLDIAEAGDTPAAGFRSWLRQSLAAATRTQYAVTLGLVPLTLALFGQISLIGPLANAIAIPLVSFVITPLSLVGSIAPAPVSVWCLQSAHTLVSALAQCLQWMSETSFAVWQAPRPDAMNVVLAMVGTLWLLAPRGWPLRWVGVLAWLPMLMARPATPTQGFWLTAFDIGQGNALLIETANHRLLYDTGPAYSSESDGATRVLLPYLRARGISQLDGLIISHSDNDHAGGAASVIEGIPIAWARSSLPQDHGLLRQMPSHTACRAGQSWTWDGVQFDMLHPDEYYANADQPNARSCTLRIRYREHAVLLTGDIEAPQERALLVRAADQLSASVLLAPHHGSGTSSTPEFLTAVSPQLALFQVGYRNRYRHPKAEVLDRYLQRGIRTLRTDRDGAVRVTIGDDMTFSAYRCERRRYWLARDCP
ncbi:ComEC Predicted membrane metal-binding protein [Oxalobacteraceae bacterium]